MPRLSATTVAILLLGILTSANTAGATTKDFTDPAAFAAATASPLTVDFNGILPPGVSFQNFNPLLVSGVTFATPNPGAFVNVTNVAFYSPHDYPVPFIVDSINSSPNNTLVVQFQPTFAIALNVGSLGSVGLASFTLSNGHVLTKSLPPVGQTTFVGFVSTDPITSLTIFTANDSWVVTDLVLAAVPQPIGLGAPSTSNPVATVSEPINTVNGNHYYQHTDFSIPGRGMPIVFQRGYNSLGNYSGPLGANWSHSYNIFLTATSATVTIQWGDGHDEGYVLSEGSYISQPGVFNILTKNSDGTFLLTRKDQTRFAFSATGKLNTIQDKNSNTISLIYDGGGNLKHITDAAGHSLTLTYDVSNRIVQITDPIGRTTIFNYDGNNNLAHATDPANGTNSFAYDSNHRITTITLPNGRTLLQNSYDSCGRVIKQTGGRGFSSSLEFDTPSLGQTTITDARGNKTIHSYDASLRIVGITDALGATTSFTYDANNDRTSVTNQNEKTTTFAYDAQGNITGIVDPFGGTTSFTFDVRNNLLTATNAKGKTTNFAYDGNGNLTSITDALAHTTGFAYGSFGELKSKTDARGNSTAFAYDSKGNLIQITDPLNHVTKLSYDGIGRLGSVSDPLGHTAKASYDLLNRLTKIADPLGNQTQFAYDPVGNLLRITDANGHRTSYDYDATNNLVSVTDALGHVTKYVYDSTNNRTKFINAKGNATSYAYDSLNRLTQITDPLSFGTAYSYDSVGNVLAIKDAKGQVNQFAYDALNRLLNIAYADGKNVAYAYDATGNRVSMGDSHGTSSYSYDALNRITTVTNPGGQVVSYAYDSVGNRKSLGYPDGMTLRYVYDPSNRLAEITDWLGRTTNYAYDAANNVAKTTYPNNSTIFYVYDDANRLIKVANNLREVRPIVFRYALDNVGNRTTREIDGIPTHYRYDALNELVSAELGYFKTEWKYDAVGNRQEQESTFPSHNLHYSYDADDRLLTAGFATFTYDANGNEITATKTLSGEPLHYQYDSANRLTAVTGGRINSSFTYDGDGNRLMQSTHAGTYAYLNDTAASLPVVLQESGPDGNISYAHGLDLISESSPAFDFFYHYDGLGSAIALSDNEAKLQAAYLYDDWGNPVLDVSDHVGTKNKFRFTGEALDPATSLYFLRARYYDPAIGRFLNKDPLMPANEGLYGYAGNNPVVRVDHSGLLAIAVGVSLDASYGVGAEGETDLVEDDQGGYGIAYSGGPTLGIQAGLSASYVISITKGTIQDFSGKGYSYGGGVDVGAGVSASVLLDDQHQFEGIEIGVGVGVGLPAEVYGAVSYGGVTRLTSWGFWSVVGSNFLAGNQAVDPLIAFGASTFAKDLYTQLLTQAQNQFTKKQQSK